MSSINRLALFKALMLVIDMQHMPGMLDRLRLQRASLSKTDIESLQYMVVQPHKWLLPSRALSDRRQFNSAQRANGPRFNWTSPRRSQPICHAEPLCKLASVCLRDPVCNE